jgi:hypothetical protein
MASPFIPGTIEIYPYRFCSALKGKKSKTNWYQALNKPTRWYATRVRRLLANRE